ncbi:MAG: hypothetical protein K0R15_2772 [Clostridiales bacterium]|jgi:hypothetical protein|nr:hypothetical protein [Clostridiales bacterium]
MSNFYNGNGNGNGNGNESFLNHIKDYVGENVIVFTESGGASGCGFEGILLSVNCEFLRLATNQGTSPSSPISDTVCGDFDDFDTRITSTNTRGRDRDRDHRDCHRRLGSITDIPIRQIVAFTHNAV